MEPDFYPAFERALDTQTQQWVRPYEKIEGGDAHQFVLFFKPEATAVRESVDFQSIIKMVLERLTAFEVSVHAIRALPAAYLAKHGIMDRHYGVINRISTLGESALADAARETLHTTFAEDLENGATVLGGHQFLETHPEFSPLALSTLNDNLGTTKLAGGSYCMRINVLGRVYLLLNPFHAYQLIPYTTGPHAILVLECRSPRDWADLREHLTGATNPARAAEGSIRSELLARKEEFHLKEVDQGSNGVHLSAGPLEGMVEVRRFFTDHETGEALDWADTLFGHKLLAAGKSAEEVAALAANPVVEWRGTSEPAFDLTEELNASEALARLA